MTTFPRLITMPGTIIEVHDGDTFRVLCDMGWDLSIKIDVRVLGINAPELKTPEGKAARDYAAQLLPAGAAVTVTSHGWDKYGGRTDASVVLADGSDFAELMLQSGHAVPFNVA